MEIIKIAELSITKKAFEKCTYEELFDKLIKTPTYSRLNDAKKLIDIELRKYGFKPAKKIRASAKTDNAKSSRSLIQNGNKEQSKGDS